MAFNWSLYIKYDPVAHDHIQGVSKMNNIKDGLRWRVIWSGVAIIVAGSYGVQFFNNKNNADLILAVGWSLLTISFFMNPMVLNWKSTLSDVKRSVGGYLVGSPTVVGLCTVFGSALMLVGTCLKLSNFL